MRFFFFLVNDVCCLQLPFSFAGFFMPHLFNSFLINMQPLTKVSGVTAVKHADDFSEFSKRRQVAELKQ